MAVKKRKKAKSKQVLIEFELRLFKGRHFDPEQFLFAVPFTQKGEKRRLAGGKLISTADTQAIRVAQGMWAYLRYPSEHNQLRANLAMGAMGGVDGLNEAAKEFAEMDYAYGQMVRLICPSLGLPGDRIHELLGVPEDEAQEVDRWQVHGAAEMLNFVVTD